jgi:TolA-binding protein
VVGTRFFLGWNPETEELSLHMKQGKVTVEGPMIPSRSVGEGETLFASLSKGTMEINYDMPKPSPALDTHQSMPADPIVTTGGVTIGDATKTEEKAEGDVDRPSSKKKSESSEIAKRATWQELADEGRFKEAVEAAEKIGINRILEEFSADDLLSLGDAARHSASLTTANRAYKAIRSRFPGTAYASSAAFALGLMAFDQQKDYAAAAGWFQASLNDRSNGALSKEALGRLMEALNLKGDKAAAEKAAARYLLAYPSGPHAALARRLTDSR